MENEAKNIIDQIGDLKNELEEIQSKCEHDTVVKYDNEKMTLVKKCEKCTKIIGYPTEQEKLDYGFGSK
jgi:DNA replicative helicase MCM subunit Mcm2 (Cdc46/Mcm family)